MDQLVVRPQHELPTVHRPVEPAAAPEGPRESVLRYYWRLLNKRKWVIAGSIAVALLLGVVATFLVEREYRATTVVEIKREAARVVDVDEVEPTSDGPNQEFYETQYTLLRSRSLAARVVQDLRLADDAEFLAAGANDAERWAGEPRKVRVARAVSEVLKRLEIAPVRMSAVVNIRYTSTDPELAAQVANSVARNYIRANLERRFEASSYAREFLQQQLAQTRQKLEESERQAVVYAAQQGITNVAPTSTSADGKAVEQPLAAIDLSAAAGALADARAARIAAESRYRQAQNGASAAQELTNPTVNSLRQQRATLLAEMGRLQANFGPDYPPVRALRSQISELDRQVSRESARIAQGVSADLAGEYRQRLAAEQQLAARVQRANRELNDVRRRSIQYNIYQRDVDTNRALYDALLQRFKEVGVAGGVGANNISIIDEAEVPGAPYKPDLRLNLMIALLLGVAIGMILAIALEHLEEATIAPAEFDKKLGIPLLGAIPVLGADEDPVQALQTMKHPMGEAYFSVLTNLKFTTAHGFPKSLLVTSTQPQEGKSTSTYALAQGLARIGPRVLLIDGDMRHPSVHKLLGLDNSKGLSNVLIGDCEAAAACQPSGTPNLTVLTCGPIPPSPAELLAGGGFAHLVQALEHQFDYILVDGPPVMGLADAPLLAQEVEATAFVLEAGRTRATQAKLAVGRLISVKAYVAGAILTKFDTARYGYGYGYGYDYDYGGAVTSEGKPRLLDRPVAA